MKIKSSELLQELQTETAKIKQIAQNFQKLPPASLNYKHTPESWSALECLQHLNLYGEYYLPAIENALKNAKSQSIEMFQSGWLGNYFANSMLPKENMMKMQSPKDKNPAGSALDKSVIGEFLAQQEKMLQLLQTAQKYNLNKIRIPITLSKWIRLKLGDTFRFNIYHNMRHLAQAQRALAQASQA
ncbi:MAG: DinB family protein [Chitinophagales bacterium]|nr:DinB family protein [Bacteroidota bacterium]MCB9043740.1 DinB family protein [Chitinophagales bacterium]